MVINPFKGNKLLIRASLNGQYPKGYWVVQTIAGWELFGLLNIKNKYEK